MEIKYSLPLLVFLFTTISLNAQWVKFSKKELAFLKNVDTVSVVITFSDLHFNADNLDENDFLEHISQKVKKHLNNTEAENWKSEYYNSKSDLWPKAFVTKLNETTALYKHSPVFVLNPMLNMNFALMHFGCILDIRL